MTTKARYRLRSILTWLVVILSAAISLAFIFSAQVFLEQGHNSWANLMTIAGSGVLALVNLYIGARIQQNQDKGKERRITRISRTTCHREFIQTVDSVVQQLKRVPHLEGQHDLDGADQVKYLVLGQLGNLHKQFPSSVNIDRGYREEIENAVSSIMHTCEKLYERVLEKDSSVWMPYLADLKGAIDVALTRIERYEEMG